MEQHIDIAGFAGFHPLRGPNDESFGVRFPPLSDAYDLELRRRGHAAWQKLKAANLGTSSKRRLHEGVYSFVAGPRSVAIRTWMTLVLRLLRTDGIYVKLRNAG